MGTHSKKRKQKKNDMVGNPDNNVAKVNTTSYTNAVAGTVVGAGAGFGKPAKKMQTMKPMKKKKKPSIYGMTSEDIKKKTKKNYGGA
tara:strand:+ start:464 stop:724 length:261 start_codon:yes stop_codon:yes gene_type:complete